MRGGRSAPRPAGSAFWPPAVLLALLTAAVYWPATGNEFTWYDDDAYVTANVWVREGLTPAGLHWAFTTFHEANWHPLAWVSHMTDVSLFGLDPFGHHLTSVLLHSLNAALLFLFLQRATGSRWRSALAGALFALHPLRVESVAWVAERKDVLAALFWMLSLVAYAGYARKPSARRYLAVLAAFALGLLSKPMALTLPFALLLLDFWPLGRWGAAPAGRRGALIREKVPFFALAAISAAVTLQAQTAGGSVGTLETYPVAVRLANALAAYVWYLGATVWPRDLAVIYTHPRTVPPLWQVLGAAGFLAGVSLAAFVGLRRRPWFAVGWLWFLGTLVPVIGLVQVGLQARADRYTYLPLVGVFVVVAWGGARALRGRGPAALPALAAVAILAPLALATRSQISWWRDDATLLGRAIAVVERNWAAHLTLAANLEKQGRSAEAQAHYDAMKAIKSDFAQTHAGTEAGRHGPVAGGAAGELPPAQAGHQGGREAYEAGNELVRRGRHREAADRYAEALRLAPLDARAHNNLGVALAGLGDRNAAAARFREAAGLIPAAVEPLVNLGNVLALAGDPEGAVAAFTRAIAVAPDSVVARVNHGDALLAQGRTYRALFAYREALRLAPGHEEARLKLERARVPARAAAAAPPPGGITNFMLFF